MDGNADRWPEWRAEARDCCQRGLADTDAAEMIDSQEVKAHEKRFAPPSVRSKHSGVEACGFRHMPLMRMGTADSGDRRKAAEPLQVVWRRARTGQGAKGCAEIRQAACRCLMRRERHLSWMRHKVGRWGSETVSGK